MQHSPRPSYFDNSATTALDPAVLQAMMPYLTGCYGNAASSSHVFGWEARRAVERARAVLALAINAGQPSDIVFTSGATEAINQAITCLLPYQTEGAGHVIPSQIEHKAVLGACARLAERGVHITYLAPDCHGHISPDTLRQAIRADTYLVSIMAANNETGTVQNIDAIGALCQAHGIVLHTDATQIFGKLPFDVQRSNVSMASISAHKLYGPKGVGALYLNRSDPRLNLRPLVVGGGHEQGLRSGTLNVPGIVGFARAAELALHGMAEERTRLRQMRDSLRDSLLQALPDTQLNGHAAECLPGLLNVCFAGIDAGSLMLEMPDFALSAGSACSSARQTPSHVLRAMGRSDEQIQASVRIGIGRFNTQPEVDALAQRLITTVCLLRSMAPPALPTPTTPPAP